MDSPQHEFQKLTRLLHLKRFEVPPPGFHQRFRARVMTRIATEREWEDQPWWNKAASVLTWQRGLVAANCVALTGVAFLAVATFHVANTVVNEDEDVQIFAALPLPGMPSARTGENPITTEGLILADSVTSGSSFQQGSTSHSLVIPVTDTMQPSPPSFRGADAAPSWLFDPPASHNQRARTPRFILPESPRPISARR